MSQKFQRYLVFVPYGIFVAAVLLALYSFNRSETLQNVTDNIITRSYEIQWRASQTRESIAVISGYLELGAQTGRPQPALAIETQILSANLKQLLGLPYLSTFLSDENVSRLRESARSVNDELIPAARAADYAAAASAMANTKANIYMVAGAAVSHGQVLGATARTESAYARRKLELAVGLTLVVGALSFAFQHGLFARRRVQHIRSFSSLFAHMTRSRIAALNLFFKYLSPDDKLDPELIEGGRLVVHELLSINEGLLGISYSNKKFDTEYLGDVIRAVVRKLDFQVDVKVSAAAEMVPVPVAQYHLIIDELVRNAQDAVTGQPFGQIAVRGFIKKRLLLKDHLTIEVSDNGPGMSPTVLRQATSPMFSTKAGSHTGFGLTGVAELVKSMGGKFRISSAEGVGTEIRFTHPLG